MRKTNGVAALSLYLCGFACQAQLDPIALLPASQGAGHEAAQTVVVYNNIDPLSLSLAGYYAEKRHIPYDHLIGLDCAMSEEISREDYDRTIARPLRKIFTERDWWDSQNVNTPITRNQIRFVVLMKSIPLKIAQSANYPGDSFDGGNSALNKNEACVDSELATLGFNTRKISGAVNNPYFRSFTRFAETNLAPMMLVCRLDAPTGAIVRGMIDDALAAEQHGLWGFAYIDARGITTPGLAEGDEWLTHLAKLARAHGVPVIEDDAEAQFADDYPMRNAAFYFGWYSENVSGPCARADFRFNQGAIACHIHSTSGATVRDPHEHWVAPLLAHGAAATLGNVYEPYLALTPELDVFYDRLQSGFTFAESAYASVRVLSWMTTFVGDPLYRPCQIVEDDVADKKTAEWIAYREGAQTWFTKSRAAGEPMLQRAAKQMRSGLVWEGLGLLQHDAAQDPGAALSSFEQAQQCYTDVNDVVRVVDHRVKILREQKRAQEALTLAQKVIKAYPALPATNILRAVVAELLPKPAPARSP